MHCAVAGPLPGAVATAVSAAAAGGGPASGAVGGPGCVEAQVLSQGALSSRALNPSFKWLNCLTPQTKLVWVARRCGDMSSIQYAAIYAVDKVSGGLKKAGKVDCILRLDTNRADWSNQRFGGCGQAPTYAPDSPTRVCSPTGGSAGSCFTATAATPADLSGSTIVTAKIVLNSDVVCGGSSSRRLTYSGRACGTGSAFVQWTQATTADGCVISNPSLAPKAVFSRYAIDVFGWCGVPPGRAKQAVPSVLCASASPAGTSSPSPSPAVQVGGNPFPDPEAPNPNPEPPSALSPSPEPQDAPSPSPDAAVPSPDTPIVDNSAGPRLPRVALLDGEQPSTGVLRIEAVVQDGVANTVDNTAGLPASQQVVVAVIDSGVDGRHQDLNYLGGKSWITQQTTPDVDDTGPDMDQYGEHSGMQLQ